MTEGENKKTILIIEDEDDLADALEIKLSNKGYSVETRSDGESGLAAALTLHPDVILLDLVLPIINGLEVLDRLRNDVWGEKANILIISNRDDEKSISRAERNKCNAFIVKANYSLEELVGEIEKYASTPKLG